MAEYTVEQAAQHLGISSKSVRNRLAKGYLAGQQEPSPGGFRWIIELPDQGTSGTPQNGHTETTGKVIELLTSQVTELQRQLEVREREVGQLHILLGQRQLTGEGNTVPWWMPWRRR